MISLDNDRCQKAIFIYEKITVFVSQLLTLKDNKLALLHRDRVHSIIACICFDCKLTKKVW